MSTHSRLQPMVLVGDSRRAISGSRTRERILARTYSAQVSLASSLTIRSLKAPRNHSPPWFQRRSYSRVRSSAEVSSAARSE